MTTGLEAITIMTIHKSKGLEFPIVFMSHATTPLKEERDPVMWIDVPEKAYAGFNEVLVPKSSYLKELGVEIKHHVEREDEKLELDALNLLYVALTRAVAGLYIISEQKLDKSGKYKTDHYTGLFYHYLEHVLQMDYKTEHYETGTLPYRPKENALGTKGPTIPYIYTGKENGRFKIVAKGGMLWDSGNDEAITQGNTVHAIMAHVRFYDELPFAVRKIVLKGMLPPEASAIWLERLQKLIQNEILAPLFTKDCEVWNERDVYTKEGEVLRPDRAVLKKGLLHIIDYKTGATSEQHHHQLNRYAQAFEGLGYRVAQKIIVYISEKSKVEIV